MPRKCNTGLTQREAQILDLLVRTGSPDEQVALKLGICVRTVESHLRRIMDKLDARNRTDLILIGGGFAQRAADPRSDATKIGEHVARGGAWNPASPGEYTE